MIEILLRRFWTVSDRVNETQFVQVFGLEWWSFTWNDFFANVAIWVLSESENLVGREHPMIRYKIRFILFKVLEYIALMTRILMAWGFEWMKVIWRIWFEMIKIQPRREWDWLLDDGNKNERNEAIQIVRRTSRIQSNKCRYRSEKQGGTLEF